MKINTVLWVALSLVLLVSLAPREVHSVCKDYNVTTFPLIAPAKNTTKIFHIGAFATFGSGSALGILRFMVEQVNQNMSIIPDVLLQLHYAELLHSQANALVAVQSLLNNENARGLIGGTYADETETGQLVASVYETPQISALPVGADLSDKTTYPYLARVNPPDEYQAAALADLMVLYGWEQAFVIYSNDDYGEPGLQDLQNSIKGTNITLYSSVINSAATSFTSIVENVQAAIATNRVRIFIIYIQSASVGVGLMNALNTAGLVGNSTGNIYIAMYAITYTFSGNQASYNTVKYPFMQGVVGLTTRGPVPGELYTYLNETWNEANTTIFPGSRPNAGSYWYQADAILTYAYALDELIKEGWDFDSINGTTLMAQIVKSNFSGVTGQVYFDQNYDRVGDYVWYNFGPTTASFSTPVAYYSAATGTTIFQPDQELIFYGNTHPVDGYCPCLNGVCNAEDVCVCNSGWTGTSCDLSVGGSSGFKTEDLIIVIVIPVGVAIIIIIGSAKFLKYKRSKMIKDMSDKNRAIIRREDLLLQDRIGRGAAGEVFKASFRSSEVAVKRLITSGNISKDAIEEFEMECNIMTALRHPNIVLFMGVCLVPEQKEMLLVMELMERGSLHDVLHNPRIQLPLPLCLHIAYQASKGMNFLHQSTPPIIHRDLKSHNILLDDKWNARISDFGITRFKNMNAVKGSEKKDASLGTIYWTAPEVFLGETHTEASDCYSFGIVLWEMFHRQIPYGGREPMAVAAEVTNGLRPQITMELDPNLYDLMTECWAATPSSRPNFEQITSRLRAMNLKAPLLHYEQDSRIEAPTGSVCMVQTDVEFANKMWDSIPMTMLEAMKLHNQLLRNTLESNGGYEIEFKNNGFFVAFQNMADAVNWCLSVQIGLLNVEWPKALLESTGGATVENDAGQQIWAGLRVRMGLHMGVSNCEIDRSSGRMTYMGPVAERTKKLLQITPNGSIIISKAVMDYINTKGLKFVETLAVVSCGEMMDSTRSKMEQVYDIVPSTLSARQKVVPPMAPNPGAVLVNMEDSEEGGAAPVHRTASFRKPEALNWEATQEQLEEKETVGRGPIGEYVHTFWKGKEVAQKVLLNQQLGENDVLNLKACASVLSKLKHKNLLEFYGVSLQKDRVSLLVGYLPNSGLPALLSDTSVQLPFKSQVKIARQIASGMDYITSQTDYPWLVMHGNLKSTNVLVTRGTLDVKLCDFGQGNLKDLARTMTSVGTVAWTAPELLSGDDAPTPKISVYSFGIIMWEIYTRKAPYANQHPIRLVSKIIAGYRPEIPDDCPEAYRDLMGQCWGPASNRPSWSQIISTLDSM